MGIWGKIVGGAAGFAIGGPIGAIVGVAAGHFIDRATTNRQSVSGSSSAAIETKQRANPRNESSKSEGNPISLKVSLRKNVCAHTF